MQFGLNHIKNIGVSLFAISPSTTAFLAPSQLKQSPGSFKKSHINAMNFHDLRKPVTKNQYFSANSNLQMKLDPTIDSKDGEKKIKSPYGHTPEGLKARNIIKKGIYAQLTALDAVNIARGVQSPLVKFNVESNPPSIFYNFVIKPECLKDLKSYVGLPEDWHMLPVSCVEGEKPEHLVTLNVYEVSGITEGLRGDWSIYVDRGDGEPSYFIFETIVENFSMDPENIVTMPAKHFTHEVKDGTLHTDFEAPNGEKFSLTMPMVKSGDEKFVPSDRKWIAANDYVFWPGGVCDMLYCSGDGFEAPLIEIPSKKIELRNQSPFAQFIEKDPSVLSLSKKATFIVSPWSNI